MQCGEVIFHSFSTMTKGSSSQSRPEKESIHSGHFMVSHFEAEAQDDEDDLAVPLPDENETDTKVAVFGQVVSGVSVNTISGINKEEQTQQQISIETSLNKLFQCMSLAYRQKLTSPKWNRFKGIKLRWKDKIRLNNVIWRCWHLQFILKQNTLVCQFASPLDVDTHIKPETTILEGKYWKRRAEAVIAEYKKWRMYYKNKTLGWGFKDVSDVISDMDVLDWQSPGDSSHMLVDEDYIAFMSDTLFSTITSNQPFAFPDTREIARGASIADFIQPSLGPLQPNLDDFMDLEPLHDFLTGSKLPPVPEEIPDESVYKNTIPSIFMDQSLQQALDQQTSHFQNAHMQSPHISQQLPSQLSTESNNMLLHGSLPSNPALNQTPCLSDRQHSTNIMMTQGFLHQQSGNQISNQVNTSSNMLQQHQPMIMQQQSSQPYNVPPTNIVSQQRNISTVPLPQAQHTVLNSAPSNQQQLQKHHTPYMQQNEKNYPQVPLSGYHDRSYNSRQAQHNDSNMYVNRVRTNSGGGGYSTERRSRPIAPAPSPNFNQYMGSSTQAMTDKSFTEQSPQTQQLNLKAQLFVGTHVDQNLATNLSICNNTRFKMPSPPPQVAGSSQIRVQPNAQQQQPKKKSHKPENFRSNSLPIGATLASVMGVSSNSSNCGSSGSGNNKDSGSSSVSRIRRPRSGSSSPAPTQRRGPAPLIATASEPLLKDSSVLLAHLLNTKGHGFFKPSSVQSIPSEVQQSRSQPHPIAIIQTPLVNQSPTSIITTTAKLVPFGSNSPTSVPSPQSPLSPSGNNSSGGGSGEHRRAGHIHAEQKRRYNIKNGFDLLQSLIPQLSHNPTTKVSKAAMLQKGAEYIKHLQAERTIMKEDIEALRQQIETLNNSLSNCQSLLPATGVTVSRQRSGRLKEMFDDYVREKTQENWKFWVFSLLVEPLLESFNNCVSPASKEELKRSTYLWAEQHCSLVEMRPAALNSLRTLSTSTDILSNPSKLPEEALVAVDKKMRDSLNSFKK